MPLPRRIPKHHLETINIPRITSTHRLNSNTTLMNPVLLSIPLAYLLGSIPFGYLLVRTFLHQDIRTSGSGNIGATNVARSGAKGLGLATLALDLLKGVAAVLLAFYLARHAGLFADQPSDEASAHLFAFAMLAAVAAVIGHIFPIWLGFRGGKGVATALGVFLVLSPRVALALLAVFAIVVAFTRYVSLASVLAAASAPIFAILFVHPLNPIALAGFCFIALMVIAKHHSNLRRLFAGTEPRFGTKSSKSKVTA